MKIHADVHSDKSPLSPTENKIFALMAEGLSRPEMSARLHRSLSTINTHFNHIFQKLDADNSTNAVVIGVVKGFLSFKHFAVYGMVFSTVFGLFSPGVTYAGDEGDHQPIQRVMGRCRVNRVRSRGGRGGRRNDDGLGWMLDEE